MYTSEPCRVPIGAADHAISCHRNVRHDSGSTNFQQRRMTEPESERLTNISTRAGPFPSNPASERRFGFLQSDNGLWPSQGQSIHAAAAKIPIRVIFNGVVLVVVDPTIPTNLTETGLFEYRLDWAARSPALT